MTTPEHLGELADKLGQVIANALERHPESRHLGFALVLLDSDMHHIASYLGGRATLCGVAEALYSLADETAGRVYFPEEIRIPGAKR